MPAIARLTAIVAAFACLGHHGVFAAAIEDRKQSPYVPFTTSCPSEPLLRDANGLSPKETAYIASRKPKADQALAAWLEKTDSGFDTTKGLPTLAMVNSGGGFRALLTGAGVLKAFDNKEGDETVSGLYQAFTYHSGLSGGAWLLSSLAGNDWPRISDLLTGLWEKAFDKGLVNLHNPHHIKEKDWSDFDITTTDYWGRLLSRMLLHGEDGGVHKRLSDVTNVPAFASHDVPFPLIMAIGVPTWDGTCWPAHSATQYEFSPYEFGSWDAGVRAFTPTAYLGTKMADSKPEKNGECVQNYDNLGYILGTSSHLMNYACRKTGKTKAPEAIDWITKFHHQSTHDLYAIYRNPFRRYAKSHAVEKQDELFLVDGGETEQNCPIWPFLQPARKVDVLIVSDNSADLPPSKGFPNGVSLVATYNQSFAQGLPKMPSIPPESTIVSHGMNKRATFFGCGEHEQDKVTIVYLPNVNHTYPSAVNTFKLDYKIKETRGMVDNGIHVALQNHEKGWPVCLGCAIMMKSKTNLPTKCQECFKKHCYQPRKGLVGE